VHDARFLWSRTTDHVADSRGNRAAVVSRPAPRACRRDKQLRAALDALGTASDQALAFRRLTARYVASQDLVGASWAHRRATELRHGDAPDHTGGSIRQRHARLNRDLAEALSRLLRKRPRLRNTVLTGLALRLWVSVGDLAAAQRDLDRARATGPGASGTDASPPEASGEGRAPRPPTRSTPPSVRTRTLADFLYFGHLPSQELAERTAAAYQSLLADDSVPVFDHTDTASVHKLLLEVVRHSLDAWPETDYLIGVSSGFDSRTLLGAALEVVPPERLTCFTSGHPGNADYDLAPLYTDGVDIEHLLFDVGDAVRPSLAAMEERAAERPLSLPRAVGIPRAPVQGVSPELWEQPRLHGFLGEISGSRLPAEGTTGDFEGARSVFLEKQARFVKPRFQAQFLPAGYDPGHLLPHRPALASEVMGFDDQLDLFFRQHQLIRSLSSLRFTDDELATMPEQPREQLRRSRDRMLVPFTDPRWRRSFLLTPVEDRRDRALLRRTVVEYYPQIFKELADPSDPKFHARGKPKTIHSAWEHLWNDDEEFRELVLTLLMSLRQRQLWFDPLVAAELADANEKSSGLLLQGLCSLEINIRVGALPSP
jgi:hypothetical protein